MLSLDRDNRNSYDKHMRLRLNRKEPERMQGHPLTTQRRLLLELLRDAGGHIDAKELYR